MSFIPFGNLFVNFPRWNSFYSENVKATTFEFEECENIWVSYGKKLSSMRYGSWIGKDALLTHTMQIAECPLFLKIVKQLAQIVLLI